MAIAVVCSHCQKALEVSDEQKQRGSELTPLAKSVDVALQSQVPQFVDLTDDDRRLEIVRSAKSIFVSVTSAEYVYAEKLKLKEATSEQARRRLKDLGVTAAEEKDRADLVLRLDLDYALSESPRKLTITLRGALLKSEPLDQGESSLVLVWEQEKEAAALPPHQLIPKGVPPTVAQGIDRFLQRFERDFREMATKAP